MHAQFHGVVHGSAQRSNACSATIFSMADLRRGVWIRWTGTVDWNGGMEWWNGLDWAGLEWLDAIFVINFCGRDQT